MLSFARLRTAAAALALGLAALLTLAACISQEEEVKVGFYAYFAPVSHSEVEDPSSPAFANHRGYEADLLDAVEAMPGGGLTFLRTPIEAWDDIWLSPTKPEFDMVGGGITILESRTKNADGETAIAFTSGHIAFRQSLLVRAEDLARVSSYAGLTSEIRVGALADTTGEHRFLEIVGYVDENGALLAGTKVETPSGVVTADGSDAFIITSARETPNVDGRRRLTPPTADLPTVIYLGDTGGERELLDALAAGEIDAIARGEIGNQDAAHASAGGFAVAVLDDKVEHGGFSISIEDPDLLAEMDAKINYLTDNRAIGYAQWLADPRIFLKRAREWGPRLNDAVAPARAVNR